jgi:hypothetical protein
VLPVKLPHRFNRRTLLAPQALAHLRTEGCPIVSAHVRLETRCKQRADGRKHRLAAINTYCARGRGSRSRLGRGSLGLSGGRERHHGAQSNHHHPLLKFFHAFAVVLTRVSC